MCGICGFNWNDKQLVISMADSLAHRGPDDSGTFAYNDVSLGHTRLSIMDLSSAGHQPMSNAERDTWIVFNGEIYNFQEVKNGLQQKKYASNSDTEAIIYAYKELGPSCLGRFNGMFAFCIYDAKKQLLFLARDRFGIKPLYYLDHHGKFSFSSEIKALLPLLSKREIDKEGLEQFFNFRFTLGETTMIKGIKKFLPGHYMIYDLKSKSIKEYKKYYEIPKKPIKGSFQEHKKKVKELMMRSVERRMVSDVPVACLLSGGIDSSIITYLAKKYNDKLNTFSIGFDTTNELSYAKKVSEHIGTNHHEFKISKDNVLSYLDKMIYHMDEPIGDPGFLPILVLSEQVKKHNKVVLSGDGGDEVFCGYDRYKMFRYGLFLRHFMLFDFGNDILKRVKKMRGKSKYAAFFEVIRLFDDKELKKLGFGRYDASKYWDRQGGDITRAQKFDLKTLLPNDFFMKADKMSSAFGLEQRVPFLDHELVEYAFSLPLKYKLKRWDEKYILKKAFAEDLPEEIVKRRKHGFDVPIDYWFKNVLGDKLKGLLDNRKHNLYHKEYAYELLEKMQKQNGNYKMNFILAQKLWSILVFEMWYNENMLS